MTIKRTKFSVVDNSGAVVVRCIRVSGKAKNTPAKVGNIVLASVYDFIPNKKVSRKGMYSVLLVTSARKYFRRDGSSVKFDKTTGVLVDKKVAPIATRVLSPIAKELRSQKMMKLISLSRGFC
jgi:large subunit ribosomal protein L14